MPYRNQTLLDAQHKLLADVWPNVCLRLELDPAATPPPESVEELQNHLKNAHDREKVSGLSMVAGGHYAEARTILKTIESILELDSVPGG